MSNRRSHNGVTQFDTVLHVHVARDGTTEHSDWLVSAGHASLWNDQWRDCRRDLCRYTNDSFDTPVNYRLKTTVFVLFWFLLCTKRDLLEQLCIAVLIMNSICHLQDGTMKMLFKAIYVCNSLSLCSLRFLLLAVYPASLLVSETSRPHCLSECWCAEPYSRSFPRMSTGR